MGNSPVKLLDQVRQRIRLRVKDIDFTMNQITFNFTLFYEIMLEQASDPGVFGKAYKYLEGMNLQVATAERVSK